MACGREQLQTFLCFASQKRRRNDSPNPSVGLVLAAQHYSSARPREVQHRRHLSLVLIWSFRHLCYSLMLHSRRSLRPATAACQFSRPQHWVKPCSISFARRAAMRTLERARDLNILDTCPRHFRGRASSELSKKTEQVPVFAEGCEIYFSAQHTRSRVHELIKKFQTVLMSV